MTKYKPRKLLAATLGLATLSLVGCTETTTGNLIAPPDDAGTDVPEQDDAGEQDDTGGTKE